MPAALIGACDHVEYGKVGEWNLAGDRSNFANVSTPKSMLHQSINCTKDDNEDKTCCVDASVSKQTAPVVTIYCMK